MNLKFLTVCLCVSTHFALYSQKETRNNFYIEGLGIAGYYSANYERFQPITRNRCVLIGADVGFYYFSNIDKGQRWIAFPVRLNLCVGAKKIYGEIGVDYLMGSLEDYDYNHGYWRGERYRERYLFPHVGLRYQPQKKGLFFRGFIFPIKVTPGNGSFLYHLGNYYYELRDKGKKYFFWGGVDVGYSF